MACGCSSGTRQVLQLVDTIQHNAITYSFDFASLEPIAWQEGDSSKLFMAIGNKVEGKKFSFATLPDEKKIRFTTRIREEASDYKNEMAKLKVGDFVEITSPGGFFTLIRDDRPILLLSNGVGIATMRSLVKAYDSNQEGIPRLSQINVDNAGEIYRDELADIAYNNNQFKSIYTKNRSEFYEQVDYESQELMFSTGRVPYFYIVGSDDFLVNVSGYLMSVGFDEADIMTDGQSIGGGCGCGSSPEAGCGCGSQTTTSSSCGCSTSSGPPTVEKVSLQVSSIPSYTVKIK